jgi:hypothetical protein
MGQRLSLRFRRAEMGKGAYLVGIPFLGSPGTPLLYPVPKQRPHIPILQGTVVHNHGGVVPLHVNFS